AGFPNGDAAGPAGGGSGSVAAVVDGTLGDTTFTLDILDGTSVVASTTATVNQRRPNVVLILLDDMGFSDFGCYGSEIHTPTIDSLAANGLRYRNFYNTARCSTTRCALLSGLYTQQAAVNPGASLPDLRTDNNLSIAELLSTTGYRRYMAGKWHLGTNDRSPISRGFQHVFGQTGGGAFPHNQVTGGNQNSFWNLANFGFYSENGEVAEIDWTGTQFHQTDGIGEYSLDFIDHHLAQGDGAPFFLYMPFNAVHWDINSPAEMADRYTDVADLSPDGLTTDGGSDGKDYYHYEVGWEQVRADRFARQQALGVRDPSWVLSPKSPVFNSNGSVFHDASDTVEIPAWSSLSANRQADLARRMALYAAMLEQVDMNIKKVVDHLDGTGQLDNTLIFILADNGGNYEGGLYGKTDGTINAAPVTGTTNLRNMGQPSHPDLHIGGGWANVANTPFRLFKHYQHEGGIRTPCIVHWPDGISSPGRWIEDRGHLIDIMATIADVTNSPYPASWPGRTLLPLEGQSLKPHFDPATAGDFPVRPIGFEHEWNRAWFKGNYKFVTKNFSYPDGSSPQDEYELYDLSIDPTELNNLAATETALLATMVDEWNAWAEHVGVAADRLIVPPAPQVNPAPLATDLFVDTFHRANDPNHDAATAGMSGPLLPVLGVDATYWDAWEQGSTEISGFGLRMASGAGMSETAIRHNFTDAAILAAGGFSVQVRVDAISSDASDIANRFAGIAIGLNAAEAQQSDDINGTQNPSGSSFRGQWNGASPGTADFFIELDLDGNLKTFANGSPLDSTPVGKTSGTLLACCELSSFDAGATVTVSAFLDGEPVDLDSGSAATTRTFTWDAAGTNYIGLSARATNYVSLDNLAIRTLPLSGSLASGYALAAGLSGDDSAAGADPDHDGDDNFTEWLKAGNPDGSDAGSKLLSLAPSPDGEFRFSYVHLNEAAKAGLTYTFRYSTDLGGDPSTWPAFVPGELSSQPLGTTHQLRLAAVPSGVVTGNPRLFILVQVE
uniref:sulfatase-like hydrolase/transferase n=1 Tax=Luteolibacter marinus TaxID=2776705 RepID=UPI001868AEDA